MEFAARNDETALSRIDAVKMILKTLSELTELPFSLVARVTEDSWTACAIYDNMNFGLEPGDELEVKTTYCNTVREMSAPLLIRHASRQPEFQHHPALKTYAVESYLGVPLFRQNGEYFGVLCALDTNPKQISEKNVEMFVLMAKLIAYELEADEQRRELDEALKLANRTNQARARFMGILGHDLRSPLNAIVGAAVLVRNGKLDAEKNAQMGTKILQTTRRMKFLIEDLLDASQTSQGNSILIQKTRGDLSRILEPLIEEFRLANPEREIEFRVDGNCEGEWDEGRLGQVLSNLLSNALSYGSPDFPVRVELTGERESVVLKVNNQGETMSDEVRNNLFTAFWRGAKRFGANENSSGLGLGLYIVKQIVETHGGSIAAESDQETGTTFTVVLERGPENDN